MILAVAQKPGDHRIGLEGPCGSGKSIGYLRAAMDPRCPPAVVLSTTRQHLQQIEDTLKAHWPNGDWAVLRGRSHYGCCDQPAGGRKLDDQDQDPGAEHAQAGKCPLGEQCRYRKAVIECGNAKVVVQCTIGHLYRAQYWAASDPLTSKDPELAQARRSIVDRQVMIVDEAHEYVKVRRDFETVKLGMYARTWLTAATNKALAGARVQHGGYTAGYIVVSDPKHAAIRAAVTKDLAAQLATVEKLIGAEDVEAKLKKLRTLEKKLNTRLEILKGIDDSNRVVSLQFSGDFVDLVAEPARAFTQEKLARVEVFTSATLAPVARLLHIEDQWVKIFPEIFQWSQNVTLSPLPDQSGGTSRANVAIAPAVIEALYDQPGRPTTIALFFSKAHLRSACAQIQGQPGVFLQGEDTEESLGQMVERAKAYGPGAFVATYGGWVGLDFPGQKWLILGSIPKSPLSAAVEGRAAQNRTSPWNDFERNALDRLQLAQGLGRALRTEKDQAVLIWQNNQAARDAGLDPRTGRLRA
jgi:Rad3-related DNA helicase